VSLCVYVLRCAVCTPYEKKEQKTVHLKWSICKTKKVYQSLLFNYSLKNRQHMKYCQTININTSSFLSVQAVLKITCRPESDSTMPDISPTFNAKAAFSKLGNILPGEREGVRCDTYKRDAYFYAKKKRKKKNIRVRKHNIMCRIASLIVRGHTHTPLLNMPKSPPLPGLAELQSLRSSANSPNMLSNLFQTRRHTHRHTCIK
jgi:hypothetical protein